MTKKKQSVACTHHWVLGPTTVPLSRAQEKLHPNCVGRPAHCRLCNADTTLLERTDFTATV